MKDLRILTILDGKPMSDKYVERHAKAAAKQRAFSNESMHTCCEIRTEGRWPACGSVCGCATTRRVDI
jgi:hypothetical protein